VVWAAQWKVEAAVIWLSLAAVTAVLMLAHRHIAADSVGRHIDQLGGENLFGPVTLILGDETLTEVTPAARTEARWDKMVDVLEAPDHLFILVTSVSAAIIPRRAFDAPGVFDAVRDFVCAKVRKPTAGYTS
jgi:hypothetical protein